MLIVWSERLNEIDRGQLLILQIEEEVCFVLQMCCGHWIPLTIYPRRVIIVIDKRLMVPLKQRVHRRIRWNDTAVCRVYCCTRQGVIKSAGIPLPTHAFVVEAVADCRNIGASRICWVAVVLGRKKTRAAHSREGGHQVHREDSVDRIVLVERGARNGERSAANRCDGAIVNDLAAHWIEGKLTVCG